MKRRLGSLDLLKLILTVIIVLHHFQLETGYIEGLNFANGKIYYGYAVEFFFIISGYVMCMQLEKVKEQSFAEYMKRKAIRLYPMVGIATLTNLLVIFLFYREMGYWWRDCTPGIWRIICSILLIFSGGGIRDIPFGLNNPIWYLCVLLLCYIVAWIIVSLCKKNNTNPSYGFVIVCVIGVAVLQYGIDLPFLNSQSARGYATFFLGMLLYKFYEKTKSFKLHIIASIVLVICILMMRFDFEMFIDNQWAVFSFVLFPSTLIVFLGLDKFMSARIWNKLGEISFEVYLWHVNGILVYMILNKKYPMLFPYTVFSMVLFVTIMFAWAFGVYNCIEKPLTRFLREKYINE